MSVGFDRLRARVGIGRIALEEATSDAKPFTSMTHRKVLEEMILRCPLTAEERSDLVTALSHCEFIQEDKYALLTLVAGKTKGKALVAKLQDYKEFPSYIKESLQEQFLDPAISKARKQSILFSELGKLGMRHGDEFTYKRMSSFLLVHSEPPEEIERMTPKDKWTGKNEVRDDFLKYAASLPTPSSFCKVLPGNPTEFLISYRELYEKALGESVPPGPTKLKMMKVIEVDRSYTCRNGGGSLYSGRSVAARDQLCQVPKVAIGDMSMMSGLRQMADFMMTGMKQLQEQNLDFVQRALLSSHGENTRQGGTMQSSLRSIVDKTPSTNSRPVHRRPTISLDDTRNEEPLLEELDDDGIPARPASEVRIEAVDDEPLTPATKPEPLTPATKPSLDSVMGALAERDRERAQQSREAKKQKEKEAKEAQLKDSKAKALEMLRVSGSKLGGITESSDGKNADRAPLPLKTSSESRKRSRSVMEKDEPHAEAQLIRFKDPHFCVEQSRSHVLCRTGFRGKGQSFQMKCGHGEEYQHKTAAIKAAKEWVKEQRKAQKLD